eukprot:Lithocolla_globosa_v1_NODE_7288_length_967_cov_20.103070.p1 type:complete len:125 gc:universal NODE_7288_length_967_cov_20.103070:599-225(-)
MGDSDWSDVDQGSDDDSSSAGGKKKFLANMQSNVNSVNFKPVACGTCGKMVQHHEKMSIDDIIYHDNCVRCKVCDKKLTPGNYAGLEKTFYCKPHFKQTFQSKGDYFGSFGKEDPKAKWQEKSS